MKDDNLKVLITGAAGFVGRYVAKAYAEHGYSVVGMGWGKFPDYETWGLSAWHEAEVSLESLGEYAGKPDVIVHCAGGASVGNSVEHPRQDFCQTVDATSHVLEFIRLHSPETRLVYPSSAAVYGQVKTSPISESSVYNPVSPYGTHKMMAEQLCQMYANRYDISVAVVRLFSIYGDGLRKQLLWDACNKLSQGNGDFFGTGEEIRDWLHVSDAAQLLFTANQYTSVACPVVNGCTGKGVKVKDVLKLVCDGLGVACSLKFSSAPKDGDPNVLVGDVAKVTSWTWQPEVDIAVGILSYCKWYQSCR